MFRKDFPSISSYYWTDSTICLHWLFSTKQLPVFICNQMTEILRYTDLSSHSHVSKQSCRHTLPWMQCRWALQSALWERGPPWLTDHSLWPRWSPKSLAVMLRIHSLTKAKTWLRLCFQSYEQILCTISCLETHTSGRSHESHQCPSIIDLTIPVSTTAEISQAEVIILHAHQSQHFSQEQECLLKEQEQSTC